MRCAQQVVLLFAVLVASLAAPAETPKVRIPRVTRPPRLEDFLKQTPREAEVRLTDFRQREPGDGVPVSRETTAYLSYDEKNLYIVFVCADDPHKVRAHLGKREAVFGDDFVGVLLDTFHDRQRTYLFVVNPLGIQQDGLSAEGQQDDYSFDTLWRTEGRLTKEGYVVWIAIPFKSLRFSPGSSQTWGMALARMIVRNNEISFWPYLTRKISSFTQQFADLEGLQDISPGRNVQLIPYAAFGRSRFLDTAGVSTNGFRAETEKRTGLDAKAVLRKALTLDLTVNPDFSQVESDEPQVTVNQRYEVFFPEKRPFFMENSDFFKTPETLFFSRRIADPQFGARLSGKLGHWALGALFADDRAPGRLVGTKEPGSGDRTLNGVFAVRREFSKQSSIGLLATTHEFGPSANQVLSFDTRLQVKPNWFLISQLIRSFDRDLERRRFNGSDYSVAISHYDRRTTVNAVYLDISPGFRTPLGFIRRTDIRQVQSFSQYLWFPEGRRLVDFGPRLDSAITWDHAGRLQDWRADAGFSAEFKGQTRLAASHAREYELFRNIGFRKHSAAVEFSTSLLKWMDASASYRSGRAINYYPAPLFAGRRLDPFLADGRQAQLGFTLRPSPRIRMDETYFYTRLTTGAGYLPTLGERSASVFTNHVVRSKLNYQFSRRLSLRGILDYSAVLPNRLLVNQDYNKRLAADVLLTYLVHPGTALHIGYTDSYENLALDAFRPGQWRRTPSPNTSTGRQLFVKLSYLFRF